VPRLSKDKRLGSIAGGLVAAMATLATGCGGPLQASELADSVGTLSSSAAEGRLLATDAAADRTKTTFVRAHARDLAETVDHEAEKLADTKAEADVAGRKAQAVRLASEIGDSLGQLQTSPADQATARRVAEDLGVLNRRAQTLKDTL